MIQNVNDLRKESEPRIRFMIQNVNDLRKDRWKPRRETETVKRKEDIKREFDREQAAKQGPKGRGFHDNRKHGRDSMRGPRSRNMIRQVSSGASSAWGKANKPSRNGSQDIRKAGYLSKQSPASSLGSSRKQPERRGMASSSPSSNSKNDRKKLQEKFPKTHGKTFVDKE